jgi:hypothetical protein
MEPTTPTPNEEPILQESDFSMAGYDKPVRRARITLYVIGGLILLTIFTLLPIDSNPIKIFLAGYIVLMGGGYIALGFWSKRKPYSALVTGLCIFIGSIALSVILQPSSFFSGLIFKIVVIVVLIMGLENARDCQRMMAQSKELL